MKAFAADPKTADLVGRTILARKEWGDPSVLNEVLGGDSQVNETRIRNIFNDVFVGRKSEEKLRLHRFDLEAMDRLGLFTTDWLEKVDYKYFAQLIQENPDLMPVLMKNQRLNRFNLLKLLIQYRGQDDTSLDRHAPWIDRIVQEGDVDLLKRFADTGIFEAGGYVRDQYFFSDKWKARFGDAWVKRYLELMDQHGIHFDTINHDVFKIGFQMKMSPSSVLYGNPGELFPMANTKWTGEAYLKLLREAYGVSCAAKTQKALKDLAK